jgi:cell pole-organizing protein PopZ
MANPSAAHEPSMEEILASIRQIISEDGEGSEAPEAKGGQSPQEISAAEGATSAQEPETVASYAAEAEIEPESEPEPEPESAFAQGEPMTSQSSGSAAEISTPAPFAASTRRQEGRSSAPARSSGLARDEGAHLLSAESGNAVHGAFSALAHTILAQNARTLEDLVAEMLQPMLRSWLDDNLPSLVERLVQEEIQRVSRGR